MFVVGQHILNSAQQKSYFKEYVKNPLIEVGNHSFSHAHNKYKLFYSSASSVYDDFLKTYKQDSLPTKLCLLPDRNMWRTKQINANDMPNGADAADLLFKNGFRVIGWDLEWEHDAHTSSPVQTVTDMVFLINNHFKNGSTKTKNHLVLLAHDEMFAKGWEESELKELIDLLKKQGNYQFDFVSEYPNL